MSALIAEERRGIHEVDIYNLSAACFVAGSQKAANQGVAVYPVWYSGDSGILSMGQDSGKRGADIDTGVDWHDPRTVSVTGYKMQQRCNRGGRRMVLCYGCVVYGSLECSGAAFLRSNILQRLLSGNGCLGDCVGGEYQKKKTALSSLSSPRVDMD